jgi:hypothetical protein
MAKKKEKDNFHELYLQEWSVEELRADFAVCNEQRILLHTAKKLGIPVWRRINHIVAHTKCMTQYNEELNFRGEPPESITLVHDLHDDPLVAVDWVRFAKYLKPPPAPPKEGR